MSKRVRSMASVYSSVRALIARTLNLEVKGLVDRRKSGILLVADLYADTVELIKIREAIEGEFDISLPGKVFPFICQIRTIKDLSHKKGQKTSVIRARLMSISVKGLARYIYSQQGVPVNGQDIDDCKKSWITRPRLRGAPLVDLFTKRN